MEAPSRKHTCQILLSFADVVLRGPFTLYDSPSGNCQQDDHDYPDGNGYGHCVFGAVVDGMDAVDNIANIDPNDICYINQSLTHFPCNPPVFIHTAYELPCELSYCSDLISAGKISFEDYSVFASHWLDNCGSANGFCGGADLDYSGGVDIADLDLFWNHWTRTAGHEARFSDLTPDYTINVSDLIAIIDRWLDSDCHPDNNVFAGPVLCISCHRMITRPLKIRIISPPDSPPSAKNVTGYPIPALAGQA